ncbi:conjugal transfer protein [Alicyclobacillus sp. SO9]|uniref:conjugal transfer protein n=1 Tax=Alicyclobacillus sp. SO9 TaxID=2665646 RepID=UPI0018E7FF57|nr:conjugal transfer protein [Alicyclobacillus sp. SO9]QQE79664.1 conjugal transfer protein [Alicyclobacillus sp. SO9]
MKLRKTVRVLMFILVSLGAIGGVGTLIPHHTAAVKKAPKSIQYAGERAFAAAFAKAYLTFQPSDSSSTREQEMASFAGNASWLGSDPAVTSPGKKPQTVGQVLAGRVAKLDASHVTVNVLVYLSTPKARWVKLVVPVGLSGAHYDVYAPPTITSAFTGVANVKDKTWSGNAAPVAVVTKVQNVLQGFLPLYFQSSGVTPLQPYLNSAAHVQPGDGLVKFVKIDTLNVYGAKKGPWIAVADVQVSDPVTKIHYEEEFAIGLESQAGHDIITGIVVN